jgi:hypothetical protein
MPPLLESVAVTVCGSVVAAFVGIVNGLTDVVAPVTDNVRGPVVL